MGEVAKDIDLFIKLYNLRLKILGSAEQWELSKSDLRKLQTFLRKHTPGIFTLETKEEVTDFHRHLPVTHPEFYEILSSLGLYEDMKGINWWDSKDFQKFLWDYMMMQQAVDRFLETGTYDQFLLMRLSKIGQKLNRSYIAVDMNGKQCSDNWIDSEKYNLAEISKPPKGWHSIGIEKIGLAIEAGLLAMLRKEIEFRRCVIPACGTLFANEGRGRPNKFCSDPCRDRYKSKYDKLYIKYIDRPRKKGQPTQTTEWVEQEALKHCQNIG